MTAALLFTADLLLVLGLTLRLTRLIVIDDLGKWWVRDPAHRWAYRKGRPVVGKYLTGLSCPFCIGFWIGVAALGSLAVAGGPGEAHEAWRWIAGALTLNWIAAHIGSRAGDAGYADEEQ